MNEARKRKRREVLERIVKLYMEGIQEILAPSFPYGKLLQIFQDVVKTRTDIDERVQNAIESLRGTSSLLGELERLMNQESNKVIAVHAEYEKYSKWADEAKRDSRPFLDAIKTTMNKGKWRDRLIAAVISFLVGMGVTALGFLIFG